MTKRAAHPKSRYVVACRSRFTSRASPARHPLANARLRGDGCGQAISHNGQKPLLEVPQQGRAGVQLGDGVDAQLLAREQRLEPGIVPNRIERWVHPQPVPREGRIAT